MADNPHVKMAEAQQKMELAVQDAKNLEERLQAALSDIRIARIPYPQNQRVERNADALSDVERVRLLAARNKLLQITRHCSVGMHEPDEVGLSATVAGYTLDNAMGAEPWSNQGELTVRFRDGYADDDVEEAWINFADIIALARMAKF